MDENINKYSNYAMLTTLLLFIITALYNNILNSENLSKIQSNYKVSIIIIILFIFLIINYLLIYNSSKILLISLKITFSLLSIIFTIMYNLDNTIVNIFYVILIIIICIDLNTNPPNIIKQEEILL